MFDENLRNGVKMDLIIPRNQTGLKFVSLTSISFTYLRIDFVVAQSGFCFERAEVVLEFSVGRFHLIFAHYSVICKFTFHKTDYER